MNQNNIFPHLHLLVSGGNSQLIWMHDNQNWEIIGQTIDDAAGECFDKVARMVGLEYPGGAMLSKIAGLNSINYFNFPIGQIKKQQKTKYGANFYKLYSDSAHSAHSYKDEDLVDSLINKAKNEFGAFLEVTDTSGAQINPLNYTFSGLKTHIRYFLTDYFLGSRSDTQFSPKESLSDSSDQDWFLEKPLTSEEIEKLLEYKQVYQKITDLNAFLDEALDDLDKTILGKTKS